MTSQKTFPHLFDTPEKIAAELAAEQRRQQEQEARYRRYLLSLTKGRASR